MVPNGYTALHPVTVEVEAQMLETVAGYTASDVQREVQAAAQDLDIVNADDLRWLICLAARRLEDLTQ